jgi:tetratricopeptide (TPR) repeat protein
MPSIIDTLNTALALQQQGQFAAAEPLYRQILAVDPNHYDATQLLGLVAFNLGRVDEAIQLTLRAIQLNPLQPNYRVNLGCFFSAAGRHLEAIANYRQAVQQKPDLFQAHFNLGNEFLDLHRFDEAIASLNDALRVRPNDPQAFNNMALALVRKAQPREAVAFARRAIEASPGYVGAHSNLGTILQELGEWDEALRCYERARELNPNYTDAIFNRSFIRLLHADFDRGWADYEYRWQAKAAPRRNFSQPRWGGEPLDGRTLLVYAEQGFGDALQFVRYAPLVRQRGGRVVVECHAGLVKLLKTCPGVDQVVVDGQPLPAFDLQLPLLSLPLVFRTTLESIPAEVPYLTPDPEAIRRWQARLAPIKDLKVGLAWQGDPANRRDCFRSIRLAMLAPLAKVPGVRLFSLQKGRGSEQLPPLAAALGIEDLVGEVADFHDTAAIISNLDLIISVDSAIVHLAGALARPVWVPLPTTPDWRWLLGRDDSPWYPSMTLFRQDRLGEWDSVVARIARQLSQGL